MAESDPWDITIGDRQFEGYEDKSCIKCDNDWQTILYDKLSIT